MILVWQARRYGNQIVRNGKLSPLLQQSSPETLPSSKMKRVKNNLIIFKEVIVSKGMTFDAIEPLAKLK